MQFIFGLGTGRCGTGTLAELLSKQPNIYSTHEGQFCPWEKDIVAFYQSICGLLKYANKPKIANIAFYWKNYLSEIFRDFNNPKIIVLKRARKKVVESFASMYRDKNHWSNPNSKHFDGHYPGLTILGSMWPKYNLSKKKAIARYWWEYYHDGAIKYWMDKFPANIIIIRSEQLYSGKKAQKRIFDFLEIDDADRVYDDSIWSHKRQEQKPYLAIDRPAPTELQQIALEKALYGKAAMVLAGRAVDVEVQLTEEEFKQLEANPEMLKLLTKEATV